MKLGDMIDIPPSDVNYHGSAVYCKKIVPETQLERAVIAQLIKPLIDNAHIKWATDDCSLCYQLRDSRQLEDCIESGVYVFSIKAFMNCGGLLDVELVPVVPSNTPEGVYPAWVGVIARVKTKTGKTHSSLLPELSRLSTVEMRGEKAHV